MGEYDVNPGDLYSQHDTDYARRMQKIKSAKSQAQERKILKTFKTNKPMSDGEKLTIVKLSGEGLSNLQIAAKLNRAPRGIGQVLAKAAEAAKEVGLDWRSDMRDKAIVAVNDALDAKEDLYKRGGLGIQALKGLNELSNDTATNIQAIFNSVPPGMKDRYLTTSEVEALPEATPAKETNESQS